jgi:hypothetical protein
MSEADTPASRYFRALLPLRGIGTDETSGYGALETLFNSVGQTLRPRVRAVIHPKNTGGGIPDGGFFTPDQLKNTRQEELLQTLPARGALEVKPLKVDLATLAKTKQVAEYLQHYGQILLTNYRAFALWTWEKGHAVSAESFVVAETEIEFWQIAASGKKAIDERLCDYLQRVLLARAPLWEPKVLGAFLASYAREARARLGNAPMDALGSVRNALEEALGIRFTDERGLHFFQSTYVQTLFYGIFSAWVLWHEQNEQSSARFDWRTAQFHIGLPVLRRLFQQAADPQELRAFRIDQVLDWTGATLNRVDRFAFFQRFQLAEAVQYFYEPFLEAFDPQLREDFGVWYTPPEIAKYMVERVDRSLRDDLGIVDGFADERVVVLDPCCGTGTYLVEVLRYIHTHVKQSEGAALAGLQTAKAARERIFGFELLPAPYVVAHLQLDLVLQRWQASFDHAAGERAAVFLTNALTGWEPPREPKDLLFPEFEQERDAADHVKRKETILVILGNPPYDGLAGIAPSTETDTEERRLSQAYREVHTPGLPKPQGQGLNDLYVRFYRMAERRIVEHTGEGIICFISNYSWLDGLSHPGMRERFLRAFDRIGIDCLNGDKFKTGKKTPDGKSDPSVFSTTFNREGIQVGTAIATLVRKKKGEARKEAETNVAFRHFWGTRKREDLLASLRENETKGYEQLSPPVALGLPFVPTAAEGRYFEWPLIPDILPVSFSGVQTKRDDVVIDIDRPALIERMRRYFDPQVSDEEIARESPRAMQKTKRFDPVETRRYLLRRGFLADRVVRYNYRPFDLRWVYWEPETRLLGEKSPDYFPHVRPDHLWFFTTGRTRKNLIEPAIPTACLTDLNCMDSGARGVPLLLDRSEVKSDSKLAAQVLDTLELGGKADDTEPVLNFTKRARDYIARLGCDAADIFHHIVAVLHAPAYRKENAGALRQDWPRIPLPRGADVLRAGASLGHELAVLLDPETPVPGVTTGQLRDELRGLAELSTTPAKAKPNLAVIAAWGRRQQGAIMPGAGRTESILVMDDDMDMRFGVERLHVYLNDTTFWADVPREVWDYTLGGYQVLKKWLSYRDENILGRPLRTEEAREFTHIARRIAAILLLHERLDEHYRRSITGDGNDFAENR